jgi:hypothetical protein
MQPTPQQVQASQGTVEKLRTRGKIAGRMKDMGGLKFGHLTAIMPVARATGTTGDIVWLWVCDCGQTKAIRNSSVKGGTTKTCGTCSLHSEAMARCGFLHGMYYTPERESYHSAKSRCTNPRLSNYSDYGGRGIEFRFKSFEEFYAEVGPRPDGRSLDRIDVNGHYEIGNLRWATPSQQVRNRRKYAAINHFSDEELLIELKRRNICIQ